MPIEPCVRLNMLRHWSFVTNMSRRAYTDLTQNNLVPLLPAHYCMSVFILSKHNCPLFFFFFVTPFYLFFPYHFSRFNLTIIWVKYNFDKLYASEINRMQKYLFLMIYVCFFSLDHFVAYYRPISIFHDPVSWYRNVSKLPAVVSFFHFSITPVLFWILFLTCIP